MGILRIGAAALVIAGGVMLAERTTTLEKADRTITGTASDTAAQAIGFCQRQPEMCTAAATAGLAAATASLAPPPAATASLAPPPAVAAPPAAAPVAPVVHAPTPAAPKAARPATPKALPAAAVKTGVPRAAAVPLPPQRPGTAGKMRPPA